MQDRRSATLAVYKCSGFGRYRFGGELCTFFASGVAEMSLASIDKRNEMMAFSANATGSNEDMPSAREDKRSTSALVQQCETNEFQVRFRVSDEAKSRMLEVERRTSRVLATSALFAFR